jgi:ribosomal protein S18 acetylase RimI-like enzyme
MKPREAAPADEAAVIALWRDCGLTRPWNDPSADYRRALAGSGSVVLIAEDGGRISGTIMVGDDGHRGWVYYLAVAPERRRAGFGRTLVAAAEAWLAGRGCAKIQLMVRDDNEAAIAFYRALGLEPQKVALLGRFLADGGAAARLHPD